MNIRENPYYYTFAQFCRDNFGRKLYRVPLDIGCSCPNREGKAGTGGCIFCSSEGSGEFAIRYTGQKLRPEELRTKQPGYDYLHKGHPEQISEAKQSKGKNPSAGQQVSQTGYGSYIAYFQSFTNTYAPAERLEPLFRAALEDDTFAGISIATRPDCMGEDIMRMLCVIKKDFPGKFIWIELGLQTMHERTAELINRGYRLEIFEDCVKKLKEKGFPVIVHVIIGLPGESREDIFETAEYLDKLGIDGIKLQLLHILKGTKLHEMYLREPERIKVLTREEYTDIVCGCLQRLSQDIVIHRLTGDGQRDKLVAPLWSLDKKKVLNGIMKELKRHKYDGGANGSDKAY